MKLKDTLLIATVVGVLVTPMAAAAQSWGWFGGDYRSYQQGFRGYPEFQGLKAHIRQEIRQGLYEGWLDQNQARDTYRRLDWVQRREQREFGEHGWQLPPDDSAQIRASLDQIDRTIDDARDGEDYGY